VAPSLAERTSPNCSKRALADIRKIRSVSAPLGVRKAKRKRENLLGEGSTLRYIDESQPRWIGVALFCNLCDRGYGKNVGSKVSSQYLGLGPFCHRDDKPVTEKCNFSH
jgi:hypothetical protein